jgi:hypothetical protein
VVLGVKFSNLDTIEVNLCSALTMNDLDEDVDCVTSLLIAQLMLNDVLTKIQCSELGDSELLRSDETLAWTIQKDILKHLLDDHVFAQSLDSALQTDQAQLIALEDIERRH